MSKPSFCRDCDLLKQQCYECEIRALRAKLRERDAENTLLRAVVAEADDYLTRYDHIANFIASNSILHRKFKDALAATARSAESPPTAAAATEKGGTS